MVFKRMRKGNSRQQGESAVSNNEAEVLPRPFSPFAGKAVLDRFKAVPDKPKQVRAKDGSPNIVIILLDDNGFASNSAFGGPSDSHELEKLAAAGLTYNSFHVAPMCSPTRAALLCGRDPHRLGWGVVPEEAAGYPGYSTIFPRSTATVAEVLKGNGYSTAAFGKWHNTPFHETTCVGPFDRWPTGLGFEYFYGINSGYDSQFEPHLYRNTIPVELPARNHEGYHLTADLVDDAIRWIHQHDAIAPEKPFFVYFAPSAVHWPHHVPKDTIAKYRGRFDNGWDELRKEIFARQKASGIIPATAELTPRDSRMPAWDSLSSAEKAVCSRQMEVYSAFLEHTDREVGRLINTLHAEGHVEDTIIFYLTGDNGAATTNGAMLGKDWYSEDGTIAPIEERLQHMEDLGSEKLDNIYAAPWAWTGSTPFKGMKQMASYLGGTRNVLVVSWPGHIQDKGSIREQFQYVSDIVPTIYDITGIKAPDFVNGEKQMSFDGRSFAETFSDPTAPSTHTVQLFEVRGHRGIYKDGWWAGAQHLPPWDLSGRNESPVGQFPWELYDLKTDYSQAHNVADKYPKKLKEMKSLFDKEAKRIGVYPLQPIAEPLPPPADGSRKHYVLRPGVSGVPKINGPWLEGRHHTISADVEIPDGGANGVILADGCRFGGFTLFLDKEGRVTYETNVYGRQSGKVATARPLAPGKRNITVSHTVDSTDTNGPPYPASIQISVDGNRLAEGRVAHLMVHYLGTLSVGSDPLSPVSQGYEAPFAFNGTINKVLVDIRDR